MPVVPFIPLIATAVGIGGSAILQKKQQNFAKNQAANALTPTGLTATGGIAGTDPISVLAEQQRKIAESAAKGSEQDILSARAGLGTSNAFYNKILQGNPEDLMQLLNASDATKSMDENEQLATQLQTPGGLRAAMIGQSSFSRDAALNNFMKQLRFAAPDKISDIAKAFGNLGTQELAGATSAGGQATQALVSQAQIAAEEAARKSNLVNGIIGTGGSIAGVVLGKLLNKTNNPNQTVYDEDGIGSGSSGPDIFGGLWPSGTDVGGGLSGIGDAGSGLTALGTPGEISW